MNVWKKLLFVILINLIFWMSVEVLVRQLWAPPELQTIKIGIQLEAHPTRIWGLTPDSTMDNFGVQVHVNEDGLRASSQPQDLNYTWMVLGDSSFFGHGLEDQDTLHMQLHRAWQDRGMDVEVICAGVPGYSILQTEILMNEVGWDKHPDVLIIGNLWSDNNFDHFVDHLWLEQLNSPSSVLSRWIHFSMLGRLIRHRLKPVEVEPEHHHNSNTRMTRISWVREPYQTGTRRVPVSIYAHVLDRVVLEAERRGVGVIFVQPGNRHRIKGEPGDAMWGPYFEAQSLIADRRSVPILDVINILRLFGVSENESFLDAMHPTGTTNYWLASSLVDLALVKGWPDSLLIPDASEPIFNEQLEDPWVSKGAFFTPVEKRRKAE